MDKHEDSASELWNHPDFPNFYHNQAAIRPLEEEFIAGFKKLNRFSQEATPELNFEMSLNLGITETLHSSGIEGVKLDSSRMYESLINNIATKNAEGSSMQMFQLAMSNSDAPLTHEILQDLNRTLLPDVPNSGEYVGDMQVVETRYLGDDRIIHRGAPKDQVQEAVHQFIESFNSSDPTKPLANAVTSHMHFETLHPFCDGNGRVGRALIVMGLCRDMGSKIPLSISRTFHAHQHDYYQQFDNRRSPSPLDLTEPLKLISPLLIASLQETEKIMELSVTRKKVHHSSLNERQLKVMDRLINYELDQGFIGGMTNEKYRKIAKCEGKTAQRDLRQLHEKGLLFKTGQLKGTRYHLLAPNEEED